MLGTSTQGCVRDQLLRKQRISIPDVCWMLWYIQLQLRMVSARY